LKENPVAQHAGVSQAARMSLLAKDLSLASELEAREIPLHELHFKRIVRDEDKLIIGTLERRKIIVEISRTPLGGNRPTPALLKTELKKIYSLLATPKPDYFKIFPCLGFCCDERHGWHGFVFQMPEDFHSPTRLRHLFHPILYALLICTAWSFKRRDILKRLDRCYCLMVSVKIIRCNTAPYYIHPMQHLYPGLTEFARSFCLRVWN
jgi:hypothetical protein